MKYFFFQNWYFLSQFKFPRLSILPKFVFPVIWREMCHSHTGVNYWEKERVTNLPRKGTLVKVWWVKMEVQISMIFCKNEVLRYNESYYTKITLYRHLWSMIHSRSHLIFLIIALDLIFFSLYSKMLFCCFCLFGLRYKTTTS